jgi:hypothetical protein
MKRDQEKESRDTQENEGHSHGIDTRAHKIVALTLSLKRVPDVHSPTFYRACSICDHQWQ